MKLTGKVAVITGGGSGIGRATAILFAQEGAKVVIGDWNQKTLDEVVNAIREAGGEVTGVQGNVAVKAQAEALIDTAIRTYGQLDILVNNAGVIDLNQGVGEVTDGIWDHVMAINVTGPMYLTRRAIPALLKHGGAIVNIASVAGLSGAAAGAAYTTSKHALIGLSKNTAWRYALQGVRCNAIAAGAVETNITASVDMTQMDPGGSERSNRYYQLIPKTLKPTDLANLILFLASDEASSINGAVVAADGGWLAA